MNGFGASFKIGKWSKEHWRYNEEINMRSPGLELNDLGYMTISNMTKNNSTVSYFETENSWIFKNYNFNLQQQNAWDADGVGLFSMASVSAQGEFKNGWAAQLGGQYKFRTLDEWILRGGPAMKVPDLMGFSYFLQTNSSKKVFFSINGEYNKRLAGNSFNYSVTSQVSYRPWSNLVFSLQPSFQKNIDELQYLSQFGKSGNSKSYLLGSIDNRNLGVTFRMDLALSPELTVQYYGSPFVSIGKFSSFKKVVKPQDANYYNRFSELRPLKIANNYNFDENNDGIVDYSVGNPDFNFHQFRSNLVVRWEYHPGSTFYLVWAQDRTGYEQGGPFAFDKGYSRMFDLFPKNIFMIKFNYWISI